MDENKPKEKEKEDEGVDFLEICIGICVVTLATFLGICNVKDNNIVQQMQLKQADRNDNWNWFQARNIRGTVYEATSMMLEVPFPNETPESEAARKKMAERLKEMWKSQEKKSADQKEKAEKSERDYNELNNKDDQFDLCEAALAIGLALMGVTALVKRWWLFFVALVPATFGTAMGIAGFMGIDTSNPYINAFIKLLS